MIECRNCTSAAVSALSPPEPPLSLSLTERLKSHRCQPATGSLWRSRSNEYIDGCGMALFQRVCELDLEGIVAKEKSARYVTEREHSTWCKLLNREYSQRDAREELFERERHSEPVAGWHLCDFRRSVSDRDNGGSGGESGGYCGTSTISAFNHVTLMNRHCSPLSNARDPLCRRPH